MRGIQELHASSLRLGWDFFMPENTYIYDAVWEEYRHEHGFTVDEMNEHVMFSDDRTVYDELEERVKHTQWQEAQRMHWMQGEPPEYTRRVPEDCPF